MYRHIVFETIFVEFGRALAAARHCDSLKYTHDGHDHSALADLPGQIFKEFYAIQDSAEHAVRVPDRCRSLHPRLGGL